MNNEKGELAAYTLLELVASLALLSLVLILFLTIEIEMAKTERDLADEEEWSHEAQTLLQRISHDLKSSLVSSKSLILNVPFSSSENNFFFTTRTPSDTLLMIGYFLDPIKKDHCYRFCAHPKEPLELSDRVMLTKSYIDAAASKDHVELISKHLLVWKITPLWKNQQEISLLEIYLGFGKTTPRYFLSTVVALPSSQ